MKRIPLSSATMRTPFHMPAVGQHETYATEIADRMCVMAYIPSLQVVELSTDRTEPPMTVWVPMTNVVKMVPEAGVEELQRKK